MKDCEEALSSLAPSNKGGEFFVLLFLPIFLTIVI